jgi:hypothetical protein
LHSLWDRALVVRKRDFARLLACACLLLPAAALSACGSGGSGKVSTNDPVALTRIYMQDLQRGDLAAAHRLHVNAPNNAYEGTGANPPPNTLEKYYTSHRGTPYTISKPEKLVANWIFLVTVTTGGHDYVFVWDAHYGPYELAAIDEGLPYPTGSYAFQP